MIGYSIPRHVFKVAQHSLLICSFLLLTVMPLAAELIDKIVAVVNDDVITLSELDQEALLLYKNISEGQGGIQLSDALEHARSLALEKMIDKKIILQQARDMNVEVSPNEVDAAYDKTRVRMQLSDTEFKEKLSESGMTEDIYRDDLRVKLIQSRLLGLKVHSKVVITEEMVEDYYRTHYAKTTDETGYYLLQMGFSWNQEKIKQSKEDCLNTAQRVHDLAQSGQDFRALAKKFSDLPSASDGGDIGVFQLDDMAETMSRTISPLKTGDISKIIETPNGYQFFKLLSSEKNNDNFQENFDAVKDEIRDKLFEEKLQVAYDKWVSELKEKAYIQKL